ncbi:MAG TPA: class II aldolase/adducin family protein, partial [Candidatus Kryptonia bacterium]|nr:class II aldolase/adducin family protein [Candidatus Kryptonia bacterium]
MQSCYHPRVIADRWNDADARALSEPKLLLYRSHLLGADLAVTNFGGGNTSAKIAANDPITGERVTVLWVKGSGDDLGSMGLSGFARLYQHKLLALENQFHGREHEDDLVPYFDYCAFAGSGRAASIDTPLHALLPFAHVDHVHPDSVIAIAAARRSESLARQVFDGEVGWLAWQRPGFDLGLRLRDVVRANPRIRGVVLAGHGLVTWGDTSKACYRNTIETIRRAEEWLAESIRAPAFGGVHIAARSSDE